MTIGSLRNIDSINQDHVFYMRHQRRCIVNVMVHAFGVFVNLDQARIFSLRVDLFISYIQMIRRLV